MIAFLLMGLSFALELISLFAFVKGASSQVNGMVGIVLGVILMLVMAGLWGTFAAPKATIRLDLPKRLAFKAAFFGLAALGLYAAYGLTPAIIFFTTAVITELSATALKI